MLGLNLEFAFCRSYVDLTFTFFVCLHKITKYTYKLFLMKKLVFFCCFAISPTNSLPSCVICSYFRYSHQKSDRHRARPSDDCSADIDPDSNSRRTNATDQSASFLLTQKQGSNKNMFLTKKDFRTKYIKVFSNKRPST